MCEEREYPVIKTIRELLPSDLLENGGAGGRESDEEYSAVRISDYSEKLDNKKKISKEKKRKWRARKEKQ